MLVNYSYKMHTLIIEIKYKQALYKLLNRLIKSILIKIILLFVFEFILMIVFLIYMACFCTVYHGSQWEWFKGGWISFGISMGSSFGVCSFICITRYFSLGYEYRCAYNFFLCLSNIFLV